MWNAELVSSSTRRPRARQGGMTMVEVAVSMALIVTMALIVERTLESSRRAERYLGAVRAATERGQRVTYEVRELVTSSRRLFARGTVGEGYLDALALDRAPRLPASRLPLVDEVGQLGPDEAGAPHTGNLLLFAGETDAAAAVADPSIPSVRYIDSYRFICVYPHLSDRVVVHRAGMQKGLDLVIWQSVEYANYTQLMAIADEAERRHVVADLVDRHGFTMAWDPTGTVDQSFYRIDGLGGIDATPLAHPTIAEDLDASQRGRLVYADLQLARTDDSDPLRKALFTVDPPGQWRPDGFELKVVGASGSRQIWLHVVVETMAERESAAVQPNTIIVSVKDL